MKANKKGHGAWHEAQDEDGDAYEERSVVEDGGGGLAGWGKVAAT